MQTLQLTFMALLLAHLLADFPLQLKWIVWNKGSRLSALVCHGLIHWALAWTCLLFFASAHLLSWQAQAIVAVYLAAHLLIDKLKYWLIAKEIWGNNAITFSLDQAFHVLTMAIASFALTGSNPGLLTQVVVLSLPAKTHLLEIVTVYLGVVSGGGYMIRFLTKNFRNTRMTRSNPRAPLPPLN